MATLQDLIDGVNQILSTLQYVADLGTWSEPVDYSVMVRQDQPAGSGSSQYKIEHLAMSTDAFLARLSGDVVAASLLPAIVIPRIHYLTDPVDTDVFPICYCKYASTMIEVVGYTDQGTADVNIDKRAKATPWSAGTEIWTADEQFDSSGDNSVTSFDSGAIAAGTWLFGKCTAVASSPTKLLYVVMLKPTFA